MTKQESAVLAHLKLYGRDTDSNIARSLGIPAPSVRRVIQQLMRQGQPISFAGHQRDHCYVLLSANVGVQG